MTRFKSIPSSEYVREGECLKCGKCCQGLKIKINERIDGDTKTYFEVRGLDVWLASKYTILTIPNFPCKHLKADGTCRVYGTDKMPLVCSVVPIRKWQLEENCGYSLERRS